MSRLIIKNLPSYVTPARLKDHFTQKNAPAGTITDVKVAFREDGTSRRFAFIGYKTEEEARKAQEWFDRTYIDSTKITVAVAEKGAKDAPAPRPSKKRRIEEDSEPKPIPHESRAKHEPASEKGKEKQLDEFLQVMQPRTKKDRTWQNDIDAIAEQDKQQGVETSEATQPEDEVQPEDMDDLEWMKRRMAKGLRLADQLEEKHFIQDEEGDLSPQTKAISETVVADSKDGRKDNEVAEEPRDIILRTGRLFVRNLLFSCVEEDLRNLFSPFGDIAQVHIPLDPVSKTSKGFAYVKFTDADRAVRAFENLDKTPFQGRLLHIIPATERPGLRSESDSVAGSSKSGVKAEKEKRRKETATKEFNWSILYMNSDAVASSIADRMNISKADILNPDSSNGDLTSAAVKLALAETHIIQETKDYLESEGIDLSSFSSLTSSNAAIRQRRSDTCILVKNIPYGTSAEQIRALFEPHGELSRVLVPPAGTIAVVDFVHSDEAAKAFKAVAYRRMGSSIIYLEKAPVGIFSSAPRRKDDSRESPSTETKIPAARTGDPAVPSDSPALEEDEEAVPGSTLFVKNLSFATTSERFTQVFKHLPGFAYARVQTKPDPKRPGQRLSMGYGFVGFKSPDAAKKALLSIQGFVLDGHTLTVKFAQRGNEEEPSKEKVSAKTTKMIVKNVPFEATKKDIRELFGAHGQLKSVRLPKKFDQRSRGFAFLEFVTRHEAENAYAALRHTHLLGRHLVLEWASEEAQDIDKLRTKAGVGYGGGAELPGRKRKLELKEDEEDAPEDA